MSLIKIGIYLSLLLGIGLDCEILDKMALTIVYESFAIFLTHQ